MIDAPDATSTRPYLIRALYEWCTDNGFTPYVAVAVDNSVQVPREYVKDGEIVLNIGFDATSSLKLGNDFIEFKARFGGTAREIVVPVAQVATRGAFVHLATLPRTTDWKQPLVRRESTRESSTGC